MRLRFLFVRVIGIVSLLGLLGACGPTRPEPDVLQVAVAPNPNELRRLLDEETRTAVYVTHDVREALLLGDRLVLLSAHQAQSRRIFDLRGQPRDGWRLGVGLRQIEDEVMTVLLAD
jgi:hypothetical protein